MFLQFFILVLFGALYFMSQAASGLIATALLVICIIELLYYCFFVLLYYCIPLLKGDIKHEEGEIK